MRFLVLLPIGIGATWFVALVLSLTLNKELVEESPAATEEKVEEEKCNDLCVPAYTHKYKVGKIGTEDTAKFTCYLECRQELRKEAIR